MDKCLGFGGLGDCFIIALKLLEYQRPYFYVHLETSRKRSVLSDKLLDYMGIPHKIVVVKDIRSSWYEHHEKFDKCFNVFAKGYIDIPPRPYHWEPCRDGGYSIPYRKDIPNKSEYVAVQVNSGGERNYKKKPVIEYVLDNFDKDKVLWLGTDTDFKTPFGFGTNYCGVLDFISALEKIAHCSYFVGFNSVMLYWALWHKLDCFLFTDHQGREDLRIHDEWKKHLIFDIDKGE